MEEDSLTLLMFPYFPKERGSKSIIDAMYCLLFAIGIFTIVLTIYHAIGLGLGIAK